MLTFVFLYCYKLEQFCYHLTNILYMVLNILCVCFGKIQFSLIMLPSLSVTSCLFSQNKTNVYNPEHFTKEVKLLVQSERTEITAEYFAVKCYFTYVKSVSYQFELVCAILVIRIKNSFERSMSDSFQLLDYYIRIQFR